MRRNLAIVLALMGLVALTTPALATQPGYTTVNLHACVDTGDGTCQSPLDGVLVCLERAGHPEVCGETEDGEFWQDSLRHGAYRARVEVPTGYTLAGTTCTAFPHLSHLRCHVHGNQVRLVIGKDVIAVNINFLLVAP